jgi:hypothetical protein
MVLVVQEVDVKAGGGHVMTIGELANHFLNKLEWYSTLFPRIPVPIQKQIEQNLLARKARQRPSTAGPPAMDRGGRVDSSYGDPPSFGEAERLARHNDR